MRDKEWGEGERKAFMDLFLQHPKEFGAIAAQLPGNRTQVRGGALRGRKAPPRMQRGFACAWPGSH